MKTKSVSNAFNRLTTLSISFASGTNNRIAHIYGNSRNQVEVYIMVKMLDAQEKAIIIPEADLQSMVFLCDYQTGKEISSPWSVSTQRGEYANAIRYTASREADDVPITKNDEYMVISKFISASRLDDGLPIAVGIKISDVGTFNTTINGTNTLNGPGGTSGGVFRNPEHVTVIAEQPVSYNNGRNIIMKESGRVRIKDLKYIARFSSSGPYYTHETGGRLERKIVSLISEYGYNFYKYELNVLKLTNSMLYTKKIAWGGSITEEGFNCLRASYAAPFSVYGQYNPMDDRYHTYMWFPRLSRVSFDGTTFSSRPSWNSRLEVIMSEVNHTKDDEGGAVTLLLYDAITGANNKNPLGWEYNGLTGNKITVYDVFGNDGTFSLSFDPEKNAEIPAIG